MSSVYVSSFSMGECNVNKLIHLMVNLQFLETGYIYTVMYPSSILYCFVPGYIFYKQLV